MVDLRLCLRHERMKKRQLQPGQQETWAASAEMIRCSVKQHQRKLHSPGTPAFPHSDSYRASQELQSKLSTFSLLTPCCDLPDASPLQQEHDDNVRAPHIILAKNALHRSALGHWDWQIVQPA